MDCGSASKASSAPLKNLRRFGAPNTPSLRLSESLPTGSPRVYSVSAAKATGARPGMPISSPAATALAAPLQSREKYSP